MLREEVGKALEYSSIALERFNDEKYSGVAYINIGTIYSKLNKRDSALIFYKKSINPLKSESYIDYLNESFDIIKSIYLSKNDWKMAKFYSDAQKQTLKKLEDLDDIAIRNYK